MLTERKEFGMISLLADGQIQVREDTVIERDGVEVSRQYWRKVLDPATAIPENEPLMQEPRISQMIAVFWTPEVVKLRTEVLSKMLERNNLRGLEEMS
jgi:hypothetical protein